jgi:hypothetical protein
MNETQSADGDWSRRKLKHEIANDFAVIMMGLNCLDGIRDEPVPFAEIVQMMSGNLQSLRMRVDSLLAQLELHPAAVPNNSNTTGEIVDRHLEQTGNFRNNSST